MTAEQLKNSILQMAVSGKLVPQDPNDEPASVLLERIRKEKEQLIKEGKIKKEKNPSYIFRGADNTPYEKVGNNDPVSIANEVPFEIPDSWEWARASSLGKMIRGKGIKRTETVDHGLPCVRYGEIYTSYNIAFSETKSFISPSLDKACLHFSSGDIIFTLTGENKVDIAKAVAYCGDIPVAAGGDMAFWTAHGMNPLYLVYYMASPYCIEQKRRTATGDIIVHISTDKVGGFMVPVPPIEEQKRIVKLIKELEPYIERYAVAEAKLNSLNESFPEKLKKSILQLSVQGKLVEQDPNDESASALLERIRAEKEQLIKDGKIKRDKNDSVIYRRDNSHYEKHGKTEVCIEEEIPFVIPDSWAWARLGSLIHLLSGQDFDPSGYNVVERGIPYITGASNIENGNVIINRWTDRPKNIAHSGELLVVCKGAGVGKMAVLREESVHIARQIMAIAPISTNLHYLQMILEYNLEYLRRRMQGVIPGISRSDVLNLLCPVPPLVEQERIARQVELILPLVKFL